MGNNSTTMTGHQKSKQRKRASLEPVAQNVTRASTRASPKAADKPKENPACSYNSSSSDDDDDFGDIVIRKRTEIQKPVGKEQFSTPSTTNSTPCTPAKSASKKPTVVPATSAVDLGDSNDSSSTSSNHVHPLNNQQINKSPNAAGDDDEEAFGDCDDDEQDVPPTTEELSSQCWKCHATLRIPPSLNRTSKSKFCLYAMHAHPLLQVPVCSVCSEEIAQFDREDDNTCHGCAIDDPESLLFLCDNCPRSFCGTCIAQSYGGGREGLRQTKRLEDDDSPWKCPFCDPPPTLQSLQKDLDTPTDSDSASVEPQQPRRDVEEVLEELALVEEEKQFCQEQGDNPAATESKRQDIANDLRQSQPDLSEEELNSLVEEALEEWVDLCTKHDHRLSDMASSLQEELVNLGVDLAWCYNEYFKAEGVGREDEEEPDWKREADRVIWERTKGKLKIKDPLRKEDYKKHDPEDVEDLMTDPADVRSFRGEGFRDDDTRPTEEEIQEAIQFEDELLQQKNIRIRSKCNESMDLEECKGEERKTSRTGSRGVSRVRRDLLVSMPIRKKNKSPRKKVAPMLVPHATEEIEEKKVVAVAAQPTKRPPRPEVATKKKPPPEYSTNKVVDLTDDSPVKEKEIPPAATMESPASLNCDEKNSSLFHGQSDDPDEDYYCPLDPLYTNSDLILSSPQIHKSSRRVKTIAVSTNLSRHLKPHQKEGVEFLWKNSCIDLNVRNNREEKVDEVKYIGGCILSHNMGLGKSLSAITLIYTLMNHPGLKARPVKSGQRERLVHTVLLVVPVNTIASWEAEFNKWTSKLSPSILVFNLQGKGKDIRPYIVADWAKNGGVLLVSHNSFQMYIKDHPKLQKVPDVLVVDEAHLALSNNQSRQYKALDGVGTQRRILLTGTPFSNNTLEYYRMVNFVRPGILDSSEASFAAEFSDPIMKGMASDAPPSVVKECDLKASQLKTILAPFVHRKDASALRSSLPPMQQVILTMRQSKIQTNLYKELKRYETRKGITNYFKRYQLARPIHNHPACLLMSSNDPESDVDSSEDGDADDDDSGKHPKPSEGQPKKKKRPWWQQFADKQGVEKLKAIDNGSKIVVLLHILTHSIQLGDKVVVFAQCLRSLDFIEEVLQLDCWSDSVPSLASAFPGTRFGKWTKGVDYLVSTVKFLYTLSSNVVPNTFVALLNHNRELTGVLALRGEGSSYHSSTEPMMQKRKGCICF
jgi:SNF2 family DNA or RNA helicase